MKNDDNDNLRKSLMTATAAVGGLASKQIEQFEFEFRLNTQRYSLTKSDTERLGGSAGRACDRDVVKVYFGFVCHMSPPSLLRPSCHSLLSPNK